MENSGTERKILCIEIKLRFKNNEELILNEMNINTPLPQRHHDKLEKFLKNHFIIGHHLVSEMTEKGETTGSIYLLER